MNSLQVTVHHAVRHLCGPLFLSRRTSESVVNKFSALLYDNLVRKYTLMKRWDVYQPSLYEEERALHISSSSRSAPLTPIALGRICKEAGLSYDYWMAVMEEFSGRKVDFKMYINPNSVSVVHAESRVRDELWAPKPFETNDEEDDNALLAEAADCAMKSPGFQLEVQSESPRSERSQLRFPVPRLSSVPTSAKISHSRTSSSSSNLSSSSQGSSYYFDSPMSSTASLSSDESEASWTQHQPSRSYATYADNNTCTQIGFDPATFELPVDFKASGIWVDFERPAIKYDGGKTMVLSGGVMLGRRL